MGLKAHVAEAPAPPASTAMYDWFAEYCSNQRSRSARSSGTSARSNAQGEPTDYFFSSHVAAAPPRRSHVTAAQKGFIDNGYDDETESRVDRNLENLALELWKVSHGVAADVLAGQSISACKTSGTRGSRGLRPRYTSCDARIPA
jgi:Tfp pilus assembly protein PilX